MQEQISNHGTSRRNTGRRDDDTGRTGRKDDDTGRKGNDTGRKDDDTGRMDDNALEELDNVGGDNFFVDVAAASPHVHVIIITSYILLYNSSYSLI